MKWEELSTTDFEQAVKQVEAVCLLPLGVIEPHGPHNPLISDLSAPREVAIRAAKQEPAIIFPWYYFGQILEAQHKPGAVAIRGELMLRLLENVCEEISRNGLNRILIVNGHGGNVSFLSFFTQLMLERQRNFLLYVTNWWEGLDVEGVRMMGHGGEGETSGQLAVNPELVKMEQVPDTSLGESRDRYAHLSGLQTATGWYANFPEQYAGDASPANVEQGEEMIAAAAQKLVGQIRAVKQDEVAPRLYNEFFGRRQH